MALLYSRAVMILLAVLLTTLLGECEGLQTGVQYQYQYTGTISTWIPKDSTQSSAAALRANVALQPTQNGDIRVKVSHIEVSERNAKDVDQACNQDVNFTYREMDSRDSALLETPFAVYVNSTEVVYLEVPQEPVWVTNIRRGIVTSFPLLPLMGHHPPTLTFGLKEDTIAGACFNWYSMFELPNHLAILETKKQEEIIEVDVQRDRVASLSAPVSKGRKTTSKGRKRPTKTSKTRVTPERYTTTPIHDTLHTVTRTLDDVKCKDNHFIMKVNGNEESVERTQRSSKGKFLIRGEGQELRLERGEVKGDIVIYTGESDDEYIRTTSKQFLQLRAVTQVEEIFPITYEPERRSVSFSVADGPQSTTIADLLGISPDEQDIQTNNAGIVEDITALFNVDGLDFMKTFQRLVERLTVTPWTVDDIPAELMDTERKRSIVYEAFLATERDDVVTSFLTKMKDATFRENYPTIVFQVLQAPTTPVKNPAFLPAMLEVVSTMGEVNEAASKAATVLNIAQLANRLCLNPQTANTCNPGCDSDFILNTLLPYLSRGLAETVKWKRLVNIEAMCSLGSPYSIDILQPIIEGTNNEDVEDRISAISCLSADHLPETAVGTVFDILEALMNNPTEFPEVRSIAFLVLTSWKPPLPWWEHVAISTWKENNAQLVYVISTTLISLSKGNDPRSENAKKVTHLAKPLSEWRHSLARSTYLYIDHVLKNCQTEVSMQLAWLTSRKSIFPISVYYHLRFVSAIGIIRKAKGIYLPTFAQDIYRYYKTSFLPKKSYENLEDFVSLFEELKEQLELPVDTPDRDEEKLDFLLNWEPLSLILAIFKAPGRPRSLEDNISSAIAKAAVLKIPTHFRLTESTLVLTSDLGLPLQIKYDDDDFFTVEIQPGPSRHGHIEFKFSFNWSERQAFKTTTLVPWSKGLAIGAGVEANLELAIPLTKVIFERKDTDTNALILEMSAEEQINIFYFSNVMYTSLTPLYLIVDSVVSPEETDANVRGRRVVHVETETSETTDRFDMLRPHISLELKWKEEVKRARDFKFNIYGRPIYVNFDYSLVLDPQTSTRKKITFTFTCDTKERAEHFTDQVHQETGHAVQGAADDYEFYSQVSQSSSSGLVEFEQVSGVDSFDDAQQQQHHSHTLNSHLDKMQAIMMPSAGGKLYVHVITVELQDHPQKYEMAINTAIARGIMGEDTPTKMLKMHVTFLSHPAQGSFSGDTNLVCLDLRIESPLLLPLVTKEMVLEKNLATSLLLSLYKGDNCDGPPVVKVEHILDVDVQSTTESETCNGDSPRQFYPFYNHMKGEATVTPPEEYQHIMRVIPLDFTQQSSGSYKLTFEAVLNVERGFWNFTRDVRQPVNYILGEPFPALFTSHEGIANLKKVCHFTQQSVKTYDGLVHSFEPSSCWTAATIVPHLQSDPSDHIPAIAIQVRFTDQWEVRIIKPGYALLLDVTRSQILVNEEPFSGDSEKFLVHRFQDSQIVGVGMVGVRVGDTVDIMVTDVFYGEVIGICGNYDEDPINDMKGPAGCLYTDPALHTIAWSAPGVGCSRFALRNKKRPLEEYRENCDKVVYQPTGISQQNVRTNCTEWKYDDYNNPAGAHCKANIPTPSCCPGCQGLYNEDKHIEYSCRKASPVAGDVQYGENHQCFTADKQVHITSGCFRQ